MMQTSEKGPIMVTVIGRVLKKYPYSKFILFADFAYGEETLPIETRITTISNFPSYTIGSIVIKKEDENESFPTIVAGDIIRVTGYFQNAHEAFVDKTQRPSLYIQSQDITIIEPWPIKEQGFFSFEATKFHTDHEPAAVEETPSQAIKRLQRTLVPAMIIQCRHKLTQRVMDMIQQKYCADNQMVLRESTTCYIKSNDRLILITDPHYPSTDPTISSDLLTRHTDLIRQVISDVLIGPAVLRIYPGAYSPSLAYAAHADLFSSLTHLLHSLPSLEGECLSVRLHTYPKVVADTIRLQYTFPPEIPPFSWNSQDYSHVLSVAMVDGIWMTSLVKAGDTFIGDLREKKAVAGKTPAPTPPALPALTEEEKTIIIGERIIGEREEKLQKVPKSRLLQKTSLTPEHTPDSSTPGLALICRASGKIEEAMLQNHWIYDSEEDGHEKRKRKKHVYSVAIDIGASPGGWSYYLAHHLSVQRILSIDKGELSLPTPWPSTIEHWRMSGQDAGSGKTLVVSTILARRIRAKTMPTYCIYVLPPSATETVKMEMLQGKYPVCWVLRPSQMEYHRYSREVIVYETDTDISDIEEEQVKKTVKKVMGNKSTRRGCAMTKTSSSNSSNNKNKAMKIDNDEEVEENSDDSEGEESEYTEDSDESLEDENDSEIDTKTSSDTSDEDDNQDEEQEEEVITVKSKRLEALQQRTSTGNKRLRKRIVKPTIIFTNDTNTPLPPHQIIFIEHDVLRSCMDKIRPIASECFFVFDEFHLMLATETLRTSCALECAKLSSDFIALSGTLITNRSTLGLQEWIGQLVDFEVTEKNYWVASAAMIAHKFQLTSFREHRQVQEIVMTEDEKRDYASYVGMHLGGTAKHTNFRMAIQICYQIMERALIEHIVTCFQSEIVSHTEEEEREGTMTLSKNISKNMTKKVSKKVSKHVKTTSKSVRATSPPIFLVVKDAAMQARIAKRLETDYSFRVFCITGQQSIDLKGHVPTHGTESVPASHYDYDIIITTTRHSTGYTLTACNRMISSVYFSNQATRDQLEGRIARIGQQAKDIYYDTLHVGLLSYIWTHYEAARSMKIALEDLAKVIDISAEDIRRGF